MARRSRSVLVVFVLPVLKLVFVLKFLARSNRLLAFMNLYFLLFFGDCCSAPARLSGLFLLLVESFFFIFLSEPALSGLSSSNSLSEALKLALGSFRFRLLDLEIVDEAIPVNKPKGNDRASSE